MLRSRLTLPVIAVFGLDVVVEGDFVDEPLLAAVMTLIQNRPGCARLTVKLKRKCDVINGWPPIIFTYCFNSKNTIKPPLMEIKTWERYELTHALENIKHLPQLPTIKSNF